MDYSYDMDKRLERKAARTAKAARQRPVQGNRVMKHKAPGIAVLAFIEGYAYATKCPVVPLLKAIEYSVAMFGEEMALAVMQDVIAAISATQVSFTVDVLAATITMTPAHKVHPLVVHENMPTDQQLGGLIDPFSMN